jgi:signal peptidase I
MSDSTAESRYMPPRPLAEKLPPETSPGSASTLAEPHVVAPTDRKKTQTATAEPQYEEVRDSWRETLETISFVVFLVLMLKAFIAEAYVIPTGSMAITLLGDHIQIECPRCHEKYTVNASNNARDIRQEQKENGQRAFQLTVCCPNCHYEQNELVDQSVETGDKVLVMKAIYDLFKPNRHDTVVFKFPGNGQRQDGPQKELGANNYIKRLWGLPGEKLAIWGGDVYLVKKNGNGEEKLEIIRKAPDKILRMRRLVNDNDKLAPDHAQPWPTSWFPMNDILEKEPEGKTAWEAVNQGRVWAAKKKEGMSWLRYQHNFKPTTLRGFAAQAPNTDGPSLITDFLAYNYNAGFFPQDWVGDLMVDAEVEVQEQAGKFVMQLNKGILRAEAIFDLNSGKCKVQLFKEGQGAQESEVQTSINSVGKHQVKFADFDDRLTVWVDGKLPFGDGIDMPSLPEADRGPRLADFQPGSLGIENAKVVISHLSLWRDIYYLQRVDAHMSEASVAQDALTITPAEYGRLVQTGGRNIYAIRRDVWRPYYSSAALVNGIPGSYGPPVYYPQQSADHPSDRFGPDEYFMLGDNSSASADSRAWGQVPQRMLLGRAIAVYWPFGSIGSIR